MNATQQDSGLDQYLARDDLEQRIFKALSEASPKGMMAPQIARAIGAPVQTCRYRLFQLSAAGVVQGRWHRRFLFYYSNDENENKKESGFSHTPLTKHTETNTKEKSDVKKSINTQTK